MMDNRFVFIAPMYNASKTLSAMMHSIHGQSYHNWHIILTDDMSDNVEYEHCLMIVDRFNRLTSSDMKTTLKRNTEKRWEMQNVLTMIRDHCVDDDIVCRIDADDYLCDLDALRVINDVYNVGGHDALWTAHRWFDDKRVTSMNISAAMPQDADPYIHPWVSSHLKTFRKRLINDVNEENFLSWDGHYVKRAGDQCLYLPILHNAQHRCYLPMVTYAYRCNMDPETFITDDARFQKREAEFIRKRGYVR